MTEEVEKPLEGLTEEEKSTIITNAIKEVNVADILLCGKCNEVYHILEEFQEHKSSDCKENTDIKDSLKEDKKPQIWAFTLWKNTKFKKEPVQDKQPTSWNIYQTWRAMKAPEKETWLTVAANMQGLYDIVTGLERSKLKLTPRRDVDDSKSPVILNKVMKASNTRRAIRSGSESKEHLVESMVSKRYNPRKKTFEYLVKWENMDSSSNTWEATAALLNCKSMMDEFEKQLQAQREQKRAQKTLDNAKKAAEKPAYEGRPQRTSKQKALNQVKAWCGAESQDHGDKRVFSDESEEDESYDKRIKLEPESESDDGQPIVTIKRVTKNGVERRVGGAQKIDSLTLPENILIPDSKGIVRISQKQIPSLSSGVYVMSKTAGIIKLDTAAASKLTQGGGQTVLKVAPKIGQTSIKVIRKAIQSQGDASNGTRTIVKTMVAGAGGAKPIVKNYSGKVYMQRRTNAAQVAAAVAAQSKKNEEEFEQELGKYDDESDGIEEMEFPEEIQLPAAESPPPDFSLCPLTGKVIDKNGAIIEGQDAAPADDKKDVATVSASATLGNLVSIAAADILDDLTNNAEVKQEDPESMNTSGESLHLQIKEEAVPISTAVTTPVSTIPQTVSSPPPLVPSMPRVQHTIASPVNKPSILSTALTNANIVRRGPPKLVRRSDPQPRGALVQTRTPPHQIVRQVGSAQHVTRLTPSQGQQVRQVRPGTTQIIRKRIVQVPAGQGQGVQRSVVRQPGRVYQQVVRTVTSAGGSNITYVATPTNSNKVISMPSLVDTPTNVTVASPIMVREKAIAPKVTQVKQVRKQVQRTQHVVQPVQVQQATPQVVQQQVQEVPTTSAAVVQAPAQETLNLGDGDAPLLITGEDGTIYQVAGQNEDGQTILITQGEDGEQQCLLVAPENASLITQALVKPTQPQTPMQEAVVQPQEVAEEASQQVAVEQPLTINTTVEAAEVEEAADDSQVVAQIVSANPPSPGGTRKVVLMLPDGNFMMTEVTAEQYAALELDK